MLQDKVLLGVEDVMEATDLRRSKVYELLRDGSLRSVKCGRRRLVPRVALEEFVTNLEAEQASENGA